ncbi:sn-glycerol-1-phosphate dehydrogenase [uncultured Proteiniphilum sp.]|uniref:sn-glycerol-1-phosphate dehydrogenase n=1 Tax=uncultured Proteiniphilum sp. TaxID=497637 RepID=UPI00262D38E9|nr:sn-glycerol-1-phosphate dehydrogenase [uncultured Proteiniphilum sp.]
MLKIVDVLKNVDQTKALVIERGAVNKVADLFKSQFDGAKAIIVADQNMYDLVGKKIGLLLKENGVEQEIPFIFDNGIPAATYENMELLAKVLREQSAIPVAVGSGIINDLTKLASYQSCRRYMCVVTAGSVDGYTAFGSSVTLDGSKQTFSCPAPQACLADIDIISNAPLTMSAAGYADIFAKVTAGADWILADALGEEPINHTAWDIVQGGLHEALSHPEGIVRRHKGTYTLLTERLMLCGLAMQHAKSTRPASGAEHHFSHLWDMEHHVYNGGQVAHGFQVAIGTLALTALYEQLLQTPIEELDVDSCCRKWPTLDLFIRHAVDMFKGTDFLQIGVYEIIAKYITKEKLRDQLILLKQQWPYIRARLSEQIIPFNEVRRRLQVVGAPTGPEEIGISREYLRETFYRALYIRRRYTILDLAMRTDMMERWLDAIFGINGIWTIKQG